MLMPNVVEFDDLENKILKSRQHIFKQFGYLSPSPWKRAWPMTQFYDKKTHQVLFLTDSGLNSTSLVSNLKKLKNDTPPRVKILCYTGPSTRYFDLYKDKNFKKAINAKFTTWQNDFKIIDNNISSQLINYSYFLHAHFFSTHGIIFLYHCTLKLSAWHHNKNIHL